MELVQPISKALGSAQRRLAASAAVRWRRLPDPARAALGRAAGNAFTGLVSLAFLIVFLGAGLRCVHLSSDPSVLVYPRVANEINGFRDPGFGHAAAADEFRALLLGASAFVTHDFQPRFEERLRSERLFRERGLRVRAVSAGVPAHMTYDSLWKYRYWYRGYDLDLVVFYHGINDARANNYPRQVFREDYTQFPYYRHYAPVFDWVERHPVLSRSFAVTLGASLVARTWTRFAPDFQRAAPYNHPLDDPWLPEGADIKTPPVFERNLEAVLAVARERGQRVLLLTYAYHLPDDYTLERFFAHETGYSFTPDSIETEVWGQKDNVVAAIEAHNAVVRRVARRHPEALFFDMERHIPKDAAHFIDVCHWTDRGREAFADGVLQALAQRADEVLGTAVARR